MSHPLRVRGLKLDICVVLVHIYAVAPLAGAWIEIQADTAHAVRVVVAPLAGAWIEINLFDFI